MRMHTSPCFRTIGSCTTFFSLSSFNSDSFQFAQLDKQTSIPNPVTLTPKFRKKICFASTSKFFFLDIYRKIVMPHLIARSNAMQRIVADVQKIAKSHASVLIVGESGTGKEVIAQAIHEASPRAEKPFIKINCAAVPSLLLESEFFGHERGAFTGATERRRGRFERAHQGTLLLDEVTEIPLELQPKLLRVLQEREFERVGGTETIPVDVRLISTTNRFLQDSLEKGELRQDLYYRLNVIPLFLSPLRERKEDIIPLAESFLHTLSLENNIPLKQLSDTAKEFLLNYPWPGNVRELRNAIERALILHSGDALCPEHFQLELTRGHAIEKQ